MRQGTNKDRILCRFTPALNTAFAILISCASATGSSNFFKLAVLAFFLAAIANVRLATRPVRENTITGIAAVAVVTYPYATNPFETGYLLAIMLVYVGVHILANPGRVALGRARSV